MNKSAMKKKSANNYKKSKVDGLYLKLVKPKKILKSAYIRIKMANAKALLPVITVIRDFYISHTHNMYIQSTYKCLDQFLLLL